MQQFLLALCIGGLLGLAGQGIRVVVGIKKTFDDPAVNTRNFSDHFDNQRLLFSLFIGTVAGMLAALTFNLASSPGKPDNETISGIIASGYAGADFIEGFMRKNTP